LHFAIRFGNSNEQVEALINASCFISAKDKNGSSPIFDAIEQGTNPELVKKLLYLGASLSGKNKKNWTPQECAKKKSAKISSSQ